MGIRSSGLKITCSVPSLSFSQIIIAKKRGLCTRELQPMALQVESARNKLARPQGSHLGNFQPLLGIMGGEDGKTANCITQIVLYFESLSFLVF
jgi:hypothetical protein